MEPNETGHAIIIQQEDMKKRTRWRPALLLAMVAAVSCFLVVVATWLAAAILGTGMITSSSTPITRIPSVIINASSNSHSGIIILNGSKSEPVASDPLATPTTSPNPTPSVINARTSSSIQNPSQSPLVWSEHDNDNPLYPPSVQKEYQRHLQIQIPGLGNQNPIPGGNSNGGDNEDGIVPIVFSEPSDQLVLFQWHYGFEGNFNFRLPTHEEVKELVCNTNQFITDRLQLTADIDSVTTQSWYIDWALNTPGNTGITITMYADSRQAGATEDGAPVSVDQVFSAMNNMSVEDIQGYIRDYVWTVSDDSIFWNVNQVFYETDDVPGGVGEDVEFGMEYSDCPEPTDNNNNNNNNSNGNNDNSSNEVGSPAATGDGEYPPLTQPSEQIMFFQWDYGFEDTFALREPTEDEINELICITNTFVEDRLELNDGTIFRQRRQLKNNNIFQQSETKQFDDTSNEIYTRSWYIDWTYNENADVVVSLTLYADSRYAATKEPVLTNAVLSAFDLTIEEIQGYITDYVWTVPETNMFWYVNQVDYRVSNDFEETDTFAIEYSLCGEETLAPTGPPVTTLAPTIGIPPTATTSPSVMDQNGNTATSTLAPTVIPDSTMAPTPAASEESPSVLEAATMSPTENDNDTDTESDSSTILPSLAESPLEEISLPEEATSSSTALPVDSPGDGTTEPLPITSSPSMAGPPPDTDSSDIEIGSPSPTQSPAAAEMLPTLQPTTYEPTVALTDPPVFVEATGQTTPVRWRLELDWIDQEFAEREPNKQDIQQLLCGVAIYLQERLAYALQHEWASVKLTDISWDNRPEAAKLIVNMTADAVSSGEETGDGATERVSSEWMIAAWHDIDAFLLEYLLNMTLPVQSDSQVDRNDEILEHTDYLRLWAYLESTTVTANEDILLRGITCPVDELPPPPSAALLGSTLEDIWNLEIPDSAYYNASWESDWERESDPDNDDEIGLGTLFEDNDENDDINQSNEQGDPTSSPSMGVGDNDVIADPQTGSSSATVNNEGSIDVSFVVSNLEFITIPAEVNRSGLSKGFPVFVEELVARVSQEQNRQQLRARQLAESVVVDFAYVTQLSRTECGSQARDDLICHTAEATYFIRHADSSETGISDNSNETVVRGLQEDWKTLYAYETYEAINDGTLYRVMQRETPDTPLYIGALYKPVSGTNSDSGSNELLLWILIAVAAFLALCCCGWFWYAWYERHQNDELYDELMELEQRQYENDEYYFDDKDKPDQHHHHHYPGQTNNQGDARSAPVEEEDDIEFIEEEDFFDDYTEDQEVYYPEDVFVDEPEDFNELSKSFGVNSGLTDDLNYDNTGRGARTAASTPPSSDDDKVVESRNIPAADENQGAGEQSIYLKDVFPDQFEKSTAAENEESMQLKDVFPGRIDKSGHSMGRDTIEEGEHEDDESSSVENLDIVEQEDIDSSVELADGPSVVSSAVSSEGDEDINSSTGDITSHTRRSSDVVKEKSVTDRYTRQRSIKLLDEDSDVDKIADNAGDVESLSIDDGSDSDVEWESQEYQANSIVFYPEGGEQSGQSNAGSLLEKSGQTSGISNKDDSNNSEDVEWVDYGADTTGEAAGSPSTFNTGDPRTGKADITWDEFDDDGADDDDEDVEWEEATTTPRLSLSPQDATGDDIEDLAEYQKKFPFQEISDQLDLSKSSASNGVRDGTDRDDSNDPGEDLEGLQAALANADRNMEALNALKAAENIFDDSSDDTEGVEWED